MSPDYYLREIQRHQAELTKLQRNKSDEMGRVAAESRSASAADASASKASSISTAQSKFREAQRHREKAADHQNKVAAIEGNIAREQGRLSEAQKKLHQSQQQEDHKRELTQKRAEQLHQANMRNIAGKLTRHDAMHQWARSAIRRLENPPETITVLFLAANPMDQTQLRLDQEARGIHEKIRLSQHCDAVKFETRWAVRPLDVLQALNECRPRIVHFSGHGSVQDEIVFQDDAGDAKPVSKEAIVQTIAACSSDVQMVFFNTCYSQGQAAAVVDHVLAAIGMSDTIGDEAARTFAAQFYSAIGFGLSVHLAFRQAKAALLLESIPEEKTPELFIADGVDAESLVFVARVAASA